MRCDFMPILTPYLYNDFWFLDAGCPSPSAPKRQFKKMATLAARGGGSNDPKYVCVSKKTTFQWKKCPTNELKTDKIITCQTEAFGVWITKMAAHTRGV
jgi:hypothetical protein